MSGIGEMITGKGAKKSRKAQAAAAALAAKTRRQDIETQEATQNRQRIDAEGREEDESGKLATTTRALRNRRRQRGKLAFSGATGKQETLGS